MKKINPVVHFEMPVTDREKMIAFYADVFGWEAKQLGPEMGNYTVMTTTEVDEQTHFPKTVGQINGGFYEKSQEVPFDNTPRVVIAVDDIREHIKKVTDAGGKILAGPDEIPGTGTYALFQDIEGNTVGIIQPFPM